MDKRSGQARRIRSLLWGVVLSIFMSVGLGAYWFTQVVTQLGSQARQETVQLLELEDAVSDAAADLSAQTQEWKDMLLRAYDPVLRDKHQQGFEVNAKAVRVDMDQAKNVAQMLGLDVTNLEAFIQQHQALLDEYRAALLLLDAKQPLSYQQVDRRVQGKDRLLRDGLRDERQNLDVQIAARELSLNSATSHGVSAENLVKLGGLAVLLPLLSLLAFWLAYRELRQLARILHK